MGAASPASPASPSPALRDEVGGSSPTLTPCSAAVDHKSTSSRLSPAVVGLLDWLRSPSAAGGGDGAVGGAGAKCTPRDWCGTTGLLLCCCTDASRSGGGDVSDRWGIASRSCSGCTTHTHPTLRQQEANDGTHTATAHNPASPTYGVWEGVGSVEADHAMTQSPKQRRHAAIGLLLCMCLQRRTVATGV